MPKCDERTEFLREYLSVFVSPPADDLSHLGRLEALLERFLGLDAPTWRGEWPSLIRARIRRARREYDDALGILRGVLRREKGNPYALLLAGTIHARKGNLKRATRLFKQVKLCEARRLCKFEREERWAKATLCQVMIMPLLQDDGNKLYPAVCMAADELRKHYKSCKRGNPLKELLMQYAQKAARLRYVLAREEGGAEAGEALATAMDLAGNDPIVQLDTLTDELRKHFENRPQVFKSMHDRATRAMNFLSCGQGFAPQGGFLLILREWNSYTPTIPAEDEVDRGGGYFIWWKGYGIVIDPGYDFIENFAQRGGRIADITHVIITHAHDDHTAELERLLMLAHQYNRVRKSSHSEEEKCLRLYLSQGAQAKLAGIVPQRGCRHIGRVVTLSRPEPDHPQRIPLVRGENELVLTVLPAYHEDVVTRDTAVGLGFEFRIADVNGRRQWRRIAFTGDTCLYPSDPDPGDPHESVLDLNPTKVLYQRYQDCDWGQPDLLITHIGSIQESEFDVISLDDVTGGNQKRYYPNHLGVLGTLRMIDQLRPRVAIISEWGEELKDIRFGLTTEIEKIIRRRRRSCQGVLPGDLTIVYDILNDQFLCHNSCRFTKLKALRVVPGEPPRKVSVSRDKDEDCPDKGASRVFLFEKGTVPTGEEQTSDAVREYYRRVLTKKDLPYLVSRAKARTKGGG